MTATLAKGARERSWRNALALAAALILVAYGFCRLPRWPELFRLPRTPLDHSRIHDSSAQFRLLLEAARVVPPGATVVMRGAQADARKDAFLHRFAVALLPGRRVLPAAVPGAPVSPSDEPGAEYVVILGPLRESVSGDLIAATPDGTIWRTRRP